MQGSFTGKVTLNGLDSKNPYYSEGSKDKKKYHRFNLAVTDDKGNRAYLELFGMQNDVVYTMDTDNNKMEVKWADRNDSEVIKKVANYRKNLFTFVDGDRREFISTYDAVEYLNDHVDDLKDKNLTITCNVEKNIYNGKMSDRYTIRNIYVASDNAEPMLRITGNFFFNKDSVELSDWNESKKITLNGYVQAYISEKKKTMYVPQTIVLDCGKIDFDNDKHVGQLNYKLSCINCEYKDGKITTKLKASTMYKIGVELRYTNAAQEIDIDIKDLTPKQRQAVELGVKKLEDFAVKSYGERISEFKIRDFQIERQEYADGCIDMEIKTSEFEENIYAPEPEETEEVLDDFINPPEDIKEETDNLFG